MNAAQQTKKMEIPSVFAFERKLDPSDALFYAVCWENCEESGAPVVLHEKAVRGTISNRLKAGETDPAKLDAKIQSPNLQTVDVAALPVDKDTLKVVFTLRILGGVGIPCACNNSAYGNELKSVVSNCRSAGVLDKLASRYAHNIANGSFLWRNRLAAEEVRVTVRHLVNGETKLSWEFPASKMPLRDFNTDSPELRSLAGVIKGALSAEQGGYALLEVTAYARMGKGQEVYPSQELVMKEKRAEQNKGEKSKFLYAVDNIAAMHSQKIGNALRTIDTWYPKDDGDIGPIAVEPYGAVTSLGMAYRNPNKKPKKDFYTLLDGWVLDGKEPGEEEKCFIMAVLIRGGVFSKAEKGDK